MGIRIEEEKGSIKEIKIREGRGETMITDEGIGAVEDLRTEGRTKEET